MLLGIEIGGTKLQLGVGTGDGSSLVAIERFDVQPKSGAEGILRQIKDRGRQLIWQHHVTAVGFGFGGPVDVQNGRVVKSHHVAGWDNYPLVTWGRDVLGLPTAVGNDAETAGLAEARFGAAKGRSPAFYVTLGSGVGGGLVVDGNVYRGHGPGAAELGHLRPGLNADRPDATVEAAASGWGIASAARRRVEQSTGRDAADLLARCDGNLQQLAAKHVAEAAADGNPLAAAVLHDAWQTLGWGIAQVITLLSPAVIVVGGGVSLIGEPLMFRPLRAAVDRYVFPPLLDTFDIVPATLGEEVVVHGALALARSINPRPMASSHSPEVRAANERRGERRV